MGNALAMSNFVEPSKQVCTIGFHEWSAARLFELAKALPVMDVPLEHLYTWYKYDDMTLREMVAHVRAVNDADLSHPIILDEDGVIMDGRHRLMKAIITGTVTIKVVRFEKNPPPCRVLDDK